MLKMYVSAGTYMYDITPLRTTLVSPNTNNCVGTTNTSRDVTITVSGHGLTTGDYVTISGVTGPTVGGIPNTEINAEHVVTVIDANIHLLLLLQQPPQVPQQAKVVRLLLLHVKLRRAIQG
jgi:hypothetical protein